MYNFKLYLEQIQRNDMDSLLSKFNKVVTFDNEQDRKNGLTKLDSIDENTAYLFKFDSENILEFHTIGMKFPINIEFFDKEGDLVKIYHNIHPEVKYIPSIKPSMFAVEYSTTREI